MRPRLIARSAKAVLALSVLLAAVSIARAEAAGEDASTTAPPKRKLSQVHRDLAKKKEDLVRYKQKVSKLEEGMDEVQNRVHSFRSERLTLEKLRRRASSERRRLKSGIASIEQRLHDSLARAGGAAELLYSRTLLASSYDGSSTLWPTAALERTATSELQSFHEMEDRFESAYRQSEDADKKAEQISQRAKETKARERDARRALLRRQRNLEAARRRLEKTQARVKELEASASELDRLVARLARRPSTGPLGKNSLPWPAEGELVARFGRQRVEGFGTWVVHHGIRLATDLGAEVTPVRPGRVVYAGPFRSYGEVVIVDHGGGFVTVYGHLGKLLKAEGDQVGVQDVIGTAGQSLGAEAQLVKLPDGRGSVYFEIRKGNLAVDPLKWLRRR